MKRIFALAAVGLLIFSLTAMAAGPGLRSRGDAGAVETSVLDIVWDWVRGALPWLQSAPALPPRPGEKWQPGGNNPKPPPVVPNNGSCTDPDGVRIPCGPKF